MGFGAFVPPQIDAGIQRALQEVKKLILEAKNPTFAFDPSSQQQYDDKFVLAEFLTRSAVASVVDALGLMSITPQQLQELVSWARDGRTVTLCLVAEERAAFKGKEDRAVDHAKYQKQTDDGPATTTTYSHFVTHYTWEFGYSYELFIYSGSNDGGRGVSVTTEGDSPRTVLIRADRTTQFVTLTDTSPETICPYRAEVDLSWLLQQIQFAEGEGHRMCFAINRAAKECLTPFRNPDVQVAVSFFRSLNKWAEGMHHHFLRVLKGLTADTASKGAYQNFVNVAQAHDVFVPIVPLVHTAGRKRGRDDADGDAESSTIGNTCVSDTDRCVVVMQGLRGLQNKLETVNRAFPDSGFVTASEGCAVTISHYMTRVACVYLHYAQGLERNLRDILVTALAKNITPSDFTEYMDFHYRQVYLDTFQPRDFCQVVRRKAADQARPPNPEGYFSIQQDTRPVQTFFREMGERDFFFDIDSATRVRFVGGCTAHALVQQQFGGVFGGGGGFGQSTGQLQVKAEARQFSSYILLLGTLGEGGRLTAKQALVVENKDSFIIPLLTNVIPTAQAFREYLEGLSPVQQRFAKAYRQMQLNETLLAICVVQVRPQLERALNLPPGSLTKEVQLTRDILEMMMSHNIAADILAFDEETDFDTKANEADDDFDMVDSDDACPKGKGAAKGKAEKEPKKVQHRDRIVAVKQHVASLGSLIPKHYEAAPKVTVKTTVTTTGGFGASSSCNTGSASTFSFGASSSAAAAAGGFGGFSGGFGAAVDTSAGGFSGPPPQQAEAPQPSQATSVNFGAAASGFAASAGGQQQAQAQAQSTTPELFECMDNAAQAASDDTLVDLPHAMQAACDKLDTSASLRPTVVKASSTQWSHFKPAAPGSRKRVLAETLDKEGVSEKRSQAFDLLQELTRGGALPLEEAHVHVVLTSTQCFLKSVLDTVVEENVSPIDRVEHGSLIAASVIHGKPAASLLQAGHARRIQSTSPELFAL